MTDKKIIAVVGGTGKQGGGLARAILDDPSGPYAARVLTRNPASAASLAARGAEVVRADLNHEASLRAAFDGAYGAFVVTNYWEQRSPEQLRERTAARLEMEQAWNAASAAKATGLRHVVWSTLEDTRPHFHHLGSDAPDLEGGYKVPHFDAKAEANGYFTDLGVPTTFLETTVFYEAFLSSLEPRRDPSGQLVVALPLGYDVLAMVGTEDVGRTAYPIFLAGPRFVGRSVGLAGDILTGEQIAATFTKVLGEEVVYRSLTRRQYRESGAAAAEEMANMFQFYREASESFLAHRDLDRVRELNPRLQSFEDWVSEHRDELLTT